MGAITIVVIVICALAGIYLYVMGLCYLCDLYTLRKEQQKQEQEKKRREQIRMAVDQAEARKKAELARRKELLKARRRQGVVTPDHLSRRKPAPKPARAAHA